MLLQSNFQIRLVSTVYGNQSIKHFLILPCYLDTLGHLDVRITPSSVLLPHVMLSDFVLVLSVGFESWGERILSPLLNLVETTLVTTVLFKSLYALRNVLVKEDE